jgi:hypothetical protein
MMFRENSHLYWLTFTNKISLFNQREIYKNMHLWSFVYCVAKNTLYYCLIGYICAELIVRVFYDSIYITRENESVWDVPLRKIDQYSYRVNKEENTFVRKRKNRITSGGNNVAQSANRNEQGCCSRIRKYLIDRFRKSVSGMYTWEEDFRFTTIVICTYTIAYIFLIHLTFNLMFFYTTDRTIYMTYLIQLVERILNISMFTEIR